MDVHAKSKPNFREEVHAVIGMTVPWVTYMAVMVVFTL